MWKCGDEGGARGGHRPLEGRRIAEIVREGFLIGGWVAMWRPLEIFLYDWWPIHAEARLLDRLSATTVSVRTPHLPAQA